MRAVSLVCLLALAGCTGPAPAGEQGVAPVGSTLVPSPALAGALAASLEPERGGALPDGLLRRRVARAAREVGKAAGVQLRSVTVLATGDLHAQALPGRHLHLSRGLLDVLAEEGSSQPGVVAMLAHLAAHEALGHTTAQLGRALRGDGVASLSSRVNPFVEGSDEALAGAVALGSALRHLRDPGGDAGACEQADHAAARTLARLGYGPAHLASVWERLASVALSDPVRVAPLERVVGRLGARAVAATRLVAEAGPLPALGARTPPEALELDLSELVASRRPDALLDAAEGLVRRELYEEAVAVIGQSPEAAGSTPGLLIQLRASRAGGEAPRQTERALRALLVREPTSHSARLALARFYLDQERPEAARTELTALVKGAPLLAELHLLLGQVEDDAERARRRYAIARDLDGADGPFGRQAVSALTGPDPPTTSVTPAHDRTRILGGG